MRGIFGAGFAALSAAGLMGCENLSSLGGATMIPPAATAQNNVTPVENEICAAWGMSLPTRSHHDTTQTADEIGASYTVFAAVCPHHTDLIPEQK